MPKYSDNMLMQEYAKCRNATLKEKKIKKIQIKYNKCNKKFTFAFNFTKSYVIKICAHCTNDLT